MSKPLLNTTPEETNDKAWKESYAKYGEADFTESQTEDALINAFKSSEFYAYSSIDDEDEESYFIQTVCDEEGNEWYAVYTSVENAQNSFILEEEAFPDRHNALIVADYEFLLNELFNTGDDDVQGIVVDFETVQFKLDRLTLSRMGIEENEGVDHHETIGTRVPGNMEFSWLYDEYMKSSGDDERVKFACLMDGIVTRTCLALVSIVNKADLETLPDGTYDLKQGATMILPSLTANDENGNENSFLPLFTSNEEIEKWGIKNNVELKEGQVIITQCRPFDQHVDTFNKTGNYDALLINPFEEAFIINKDFIDLYSHNDQEEEEEVLAS